MSANTEKLNCQVLVIGAGAGGLPAALTAAEMGADVVLLEKRKSIGGNAKISSGIFAADSPVQKRSLIDAPKDDLFKKGMAYGHWAMNAGLFRAFVDKSGDSVKWLESMGLSFHLKPFRPGQYPPVFHVFDGEGAAFVRTMAQRCEAAGVRTFTELGATELITDGDGRVTGVVATGKGGDVEITAPCVIIATGGYAGNKELLKKYYAYYTENLHNMGLPHMGDGLQMATAAGAATHGLGIIHIGGPCFPDHSHLANASREPKTIWVNKNGERFFDEGIAFNWPEAANALDQQPGQVSYTLIDESIKNDLMQGSGIDCGIMLLAPGTPLTDLETDLQKAADKGTVKKSPDINGLAEWIGAAPDILCRTIENYNRYCRQGHDEAFAKAPKYLMPLTTPPYYAIRCIQVTHGTLGGIKINRHMEVLNHEQESIPGLYAVGTDTGGWFSDTYDLTMTGNAFGFAVNSGRIAAENAVAYLGKK